MDILGTRAVGSLSRVVANETKKGYFPTQEPDVTWVCEALDVSCWSLRGKHGAVSVLDPCAGEGRFLSAVKRRLRDAIRDDNRNADIEVLTFAVELDGERFSSIRGTRQKVCGSFFDADASGQFDLVLLNPPYQRSSGGGGELVEWLRRSARMTSWRGLIVLIVPDREWQRREMQEYVKQNLRYVAAYRSARYATWNQVVVFLGQEGFGVSYGSTPKTDPVTEVSHTWAEAHAASGGYYRRLSLTPHTEAPPLLVSRDLSELYRRLRTLVETKGTQMLRQTYPTEYDTDCRPAMSLRTAHAVQIAAMRSTVEPVSINGQPYLGRYLIRQVAETFDNPDDGSTVTISKPTIEPVLLAADGSRLSLADTPWDPYALNRELSAALLRRISAVTPPLHEVGTDPDFLRGALEPLGLFPPQREVVKAIAKVYASGERGAICRASTGTGKTYVARGVIQALDVKRALMVTEPHLVPQMVEEYATASFPVYVIDSWERVKWLARENPPGLYLLAYSRFRQHPAYEQVLLRRRVLASREDSGKKGVEVASCCPTCWQPLDPQLVPRRTEKGKCLFCQGPLYTYVAENQKPGVSYGRWLRAIEAGDVSHVVTHNKQLPYLRHLRRMRFELLIVDEAHNCANVLSNQGSAFIRLAASIPRVLALTATITNGYAKSWFNVLWGVCPERMKAHGWARQGVALWQGHYGAYKQVKKQDDNNRHRAAERVTTYDAPGISPAVLGYVLPNLVTMASEDFDDLPPVEREVVRCTPHPLVEECEQAILKIIQDADVAEDERLALASVRTAALLRVADTFCHADDELRLRGTLLGTLRRRSIDGELLEKERRLVELVEEATQRGERVLVYLADTQKCDLRPVVAGILRRHAGVTVDVLTDSIKAQEVVSWFQKTRGQVALCGMKRAGTGLNLSEFPNVVWFQYTSNTRLAEQGDGRVRRVNTAMLHRALYGEVRPVRYTYLVAGKVQELLLSYTLEKRSTAKLSEGETPDIDPGECTSGDASFAALLTRALRQGKFEYTDPSVLLQRMTRAENERVRQDNKLPRATRPMLTPQAQAVLVRSGLCPPRLLVPGAVVSTRPLQLSLF